MRLILHRLPAIGISLFLALLCTAFAGARFHGPNTATTIVVTNTNDSGPGSLRQAIAIANDGDTIGFAVTGTIILTSMELLIDRNIQIIGPGPGLLTVSRDNQAFFNFRIFDINPNHGVTISGLSITGGRLENDSGAGIFNFFSTLTLNNCVVSGNTIATT